MGERNTEFCGRILIFLSQVFPLGERSGVNLRGEYGPPWDGPVAKPAKPKGKKEKDDKNKMAVDESSDVLEEARKEGTPPSKRSSSSIQTSFPQISITRSGHCNNRLLDLACSRTRQPFPPLRNQ